MNKKSDINKKKIQDEILDLKKSLLNMKFQKSSGQLEKTSQIKINRRKIASLKTKLTLNMGDKNA